MSTQPVHRAAAASPSIPMANPAAKKPLSDMARLWMELGIAGRAPQVKAAQPPVTQPPVAQWRWNQVTNCPLHDDDLHAMVRYVGQLSTYLFTGGKDGSVMAATTDEADQGIPGHEVVAARGMVNQYGTWVPAWVTAMAVHPEEAFVAVGYRDGLIQCYDITDPWQWVPKQSISVASRRNSNQKDNNEGRIHHLSYVSPVETEGNKPVLAAGVSGACVRVSYSNRQTVIRLSEGVWLNDVVELSPRDLCLLEGEIVSQYRWAGKKAGWQKLVAVRLGDPAETTSLGFKTDWKNELFWDGVKKAQAYGTSMVHVKARKQLVVALNSGAIRLINLSSDEKGNQKLNCYESEKDLLITGLCRWVWNDYSWAGNEERGRPSRRCWKIADLGDNAIVLGTDSGELPVVDLRTKKVVTSILVSKEQRSAVLVWDDKTSHLYTHSCPTDPTATEVAALYAIELRKEVPEQTVASSSTASSSEVQPA